MIFDIGEKFARKFCYDQYVVRIGPIETDNEAVSRISGEQTRVSDTDAFNPRATINPRRGALRIQCERHTLPLVLDDVYHPQGGELVHKLRDQSEAQKLHPPDQQRGEGVSSKEVRHDDDGGKGGASRGVEECTHKVMHILMGNLHIRLEYAQNLEEEDA